MNILLLGGTGFIGRNVVQKLVENGHKVSLIIHENIPENLTKIKDKLIIFYGNILDKNTIKDAFKNQDIIVNLVGQICKDRYLFYNLNIIGALNVSELCVENKIEDIVLISSYLVYGESDETPSKELDLPDQKTNYSLTKLITENIYIHFAREHNFNLSILRLSNVYGPNKRTGVIYNFINALKKNNEIIILNDGEQSRDFIYIDDAVDGIIKAIENLPKGIEIFNISTSTKVNLLEVISIIEKGLPGKTKIRFVQDNAYNEKCVWADNNKAKRVFSFSPKINLKQGIKKTINSLSKNTQSK